MQRPVASDLIPVAPTRLPYRPELDAIRGVAVLVVLFQHFGLVGVGPDNHRAGQAGVTLFFVLSGFLITGLLRAEHEARGTVSLRAFYVRRARRLWPALIAVVAVCVVAGLPGNPLLPLTYTTNIAMTLDPSAEAGGVFRHTWTLAIEEQFYLVWPVAFLALVRRPRAIVPILVAVIVLAAVLRPYTGLLQRWDALLAGALLTYLPARVPTWAGMLGWVAFLVLSVYPGDASSEWMHVITGLSVLIVAAPGPIGRVKSLVRLGTISYALYLWSFPIADRTWNIVEQVSVPYKLAWTIGGISLAILLAALSTRYIERRWRVRSDARDVNDVLLEVGGVLTRPLVADHDVPVGR